MTTANDMNLLADRFMRAIETGDLPAIRACYAPDARIWHNNDGLEQTVEENARVLDWVVRHLPKRHYEIKSRHVFDGGYVQQHVLQGTLRNGKAFSMPACLVVTVTNGKIARLEEYLDSAQTQPLREA